MRHRGHSHSAVRKEGIYNGKWNKTALERGAENYVTDKKPPSFSAGVTGWTASWCQSSCEGLSALSCSCCCRCYPGTPSSLPFLLLQVLSAGTPSSLPFLLLQVLSAGTPSSLPFLLLQVLSWYPIFSPVPAAAGAICWYPIFSPVPAAAGALLVPHLLSRSCCCRCYPGTPSSLPFLLLQVLSAGTPSSLPFLLLQVLSAGTPSSLPFLLLQVLSWYPIFSPVPAAAGALLVPHLLSRSCCCRCYPGTPSSLPFLLLQVLSAGTPSSLPFLLLQVLSAGTPSSLLFLLLQVLSAGTPSSLPFLLLQVLSWYPIFSPVPAAAGALLVPHLLSRSCCCRCYLLVPHLLSAI
ncbi:uncharacterized protein LOC121456559 [Microtus oregoni]|uniref:uncharacterized protein LOC121456559 n=1 Tax=Microtus oregoni TaxID=111838 RepID=UPI001BB25F1F|nr:uncharacterized protein LOC121456559 [Microtus oregoni]